MEVIDEDDVGERGESIAGTFLASNLNRNQSEDFDSLRADSKETLGNSSSTKQNRPSIVKSR